MPTSQPSRRGVLKAIASTGALVLAGSAAGRQSGPAAAQTTADGTDTGPDIDAAWSRDVEQVPSFEPTLTSESLYYTTDDEVVAVSTTDWSQRWRVGVDADDPSVAAVGDGQVYVTGASAGIGDGSLRALAASDGTEQWTHESVGDAVATLGSTVYQAGDGLQALAADGTVRWRADGEFSAVATGSDTVFVVGRAENGGDEYSEDRLFALGTADGTEQWSLNPSGTEVRRPVVGDDALYVGTSAQLLYAVGVADGTERWRVVTSRSTTQPAVAGDTVYLGDSDGVSALAESDGSERWRFEASGVSGVAAGPSSVYVGADEGAYAVSASGTERWYFETPQDVLFGPETAAGNVLFSAADRQELDEAGTAYVVDDPGATTPTPTDTPTDTPTAAPTDVPPPATASPPEPPTTAPSRTTTGPAGEGSATTARTTAPGTTETTDADGPGFDVVATVSALGLGGWRLLRGGDEN